MTVSNQLPAPAVSKPSHTDVVKADIYQKFVEFMSMPDPDKAALFNIPKDEKGKYERMPTLQDFALKFGVHPNTLTAWKARADFGPGVLSRRMAWGANLTPNVLAALYRRCIQFGRSEDVESWLAIMEGFDRKKGNPMIEVNNFTVNDLRVLVAALPKEKQDQFHATLSNIIVEARNAGIDVAG